MNRQLLKGFEAVWQALVLRRRYRFIGILMLYTVIIGLSGGPGCLVEHLIAENRASFLP
jgi:hypothetical protein